MGARQGTEDFFLNNTDEIRQSIEQTTGTMTLLIASIAAISLTQSKRWRGSEERSAKRTAARVDQLGQLPELRWLEQD